MAQGIANLRPSPAGGTQAGAFADTRDLGLAGLRARVILQSADRLDKITLPAPALLTDGAHFLLAKLSDDSILTHDLQQQRPQVLTRTEFEDEKFARGQNRHAPCDRLRDSPIRQHQTEAMRER
jgi:hypothetical protein